MICLSALLWVINNYALFDCVYDMLQILKGVGVVGDGGGWVGIGKCLILSMKPWHTV